jgi:Concanavalin A-like lectin/glucanases superfamily
MPNPIKYTAGTETLALKKGNFYIGTGDVGKGPSDTTGYYQGPSPASGGYVVYLNKSGVPGNLSYHSATNDNQLISFTNNLSGTSFTSATQCLNYYATQTDKVCLNIDYESIVTDGLICNLDVGFTPSYPLTGTVCYDVSVRNINASLVNGPTYNSSDGGNLIFDGVDDQLTLPINTFNSGSPQQGTYSIWMKFPPLNTLSQTVLFNDGGTFGVSAVTLYRNPNFGTNQYSWLLYYTGSTGPFGFYLQGTTYTPGEWSETTFTFDNTGRGSIYKNGVLINSSIVTNGGSFISWKRSGNNLVSYNAGSGAGSGSFQCLKAYDRALSGSEVLQNFNALKGRFGL